VLGLDPLAIGIDCGNQPAIIVLFVTADAHAPGRLTNRKPPNPRTASDPATSQINAINPDYS